MSGDEEDPLATLRENLDILVREARASGVPVLGARYPAAVGAHSGPPTSALVPGIEVDQVITMRRDDAFSRTRLSALLAGSGRDQLVITGGHAHIECLATAARARVLGWYPFLVGDACVDVDAEGHRLALGYVAGRLGATLCGDRVIDGWLAGRRLEPART